MPGAVGVIFDLRRAATRPGEGICVTGSRAELGWWKPLPQGLEEEVRSLRTSPARYPSWASQAPIWLKFGPEDTEIAFEYKFVRDMRALSPLSHKHAIWEDDIGNRRVSLPAKDGSLWIVSDGCWDCKDDSVHITRLPEPSPEQSDSKCQDYSMLTPREQGSSEPPWPIEAEFSACFSRAQSCGSDEHVAGRSLSKDCLELQLQNEQLRSVVTEALAQVEQFFPENADLRGRFLGESKGGFLGKDYSMLTPRERGSSQPPWPIEAEFSACFSRAQSCGSDEHVAGRSLSKDCLELQLENEHLRSAVTEALAQVERLFSENADMRGRFLRESRGGFLGMDDEDLDEPQAEPQVKEGSSKARRRSLPW